MSISLSNNPKNMHSNRSKVTNNTSTNAGKSNYHSYNLSMGSNKKARNKGGSKPRTSNRYHSKNRSKKVFLNHSVTHSEVKL